MSVDFSKPMGSHVSPQNVPNDTASREFGQSAVDLAKEAYKVNADLLSIQRALVEIAHYKVELFVFEAELNEFLKLEKPPQPAFSDLARKVFELSALVEGKKAAVEQAQGEMERQAILAGSA